MNEKKKMGRPTEAPKNKGYRLRMSDVDVHKLEECCKLTGLSKAEVIRLGIEKVYNEVSK